MCHTNPIPCCGKNLGIIESNRAISTPSPLQYIVWSTYLLHTTAVCLVEPCQAYAPVQRYEVLVTSERSDLQLLAMWSVNVGVCGRASFQQGRVGHTILPGKCRSKLHSFRPTVDTFIRASKHTREYLLSVQMNDFQVLWSHRTPILWRKSGRLYTYDIATSKKAGWEI